MSDRGETSGQPLDASDREASDSETPLSEPPRPFSCWVVNRAAWWLVGWVLLAIVSRWLAPAWDDVALDGDYRYLPATTTSVAGARFLDEALAQQRPRSEMVVVLACSEEGDFPNDHELIGLDLLRRLNHRLYEVAYQRALELGYECGPVDGISSDGELEPPAELNADGTTQADGALPDAPEYVRWVLLAHTALDETIELDGEFYERLGERVPENDPTPVEPRFAIAYWDRAKLRAQLKVVESAVANDRDAARVLDPDIEDGLVPIGERERRAWKALLDVYTWKDGTIGPELARPSARVAVLPLLDDLTATNNIDLLAELRQLINDVCVYSDIYLKDDSPVKTGDLQIVVTGSAAVGGETLTAARTAIAYTEWFTLMMILVILVVVYRSPLLVLVPLLSIGVAVVVSAATVTALSGLSLAGWLGEFDFRIYTTSRIFVVVILFGAGTDYCLFLIARLREEAAGYPWPIACERALSGVSSALLGSALTTIVGLAMLSIADFGKFRHTGPAIALCLSIGLLVCLTWTPALLRLLGPAVFWPGGIGRSSPSPRTLWLSSRVAGERTVAGQTYWNTIAIALTRLPWLTLVLGMTLMSVPAIHGMVHEKDVTYDLTGQLDFDAESRRGLRLLDRNFGVGQTNPITVLVVTKDQQSTDTLRQTTARLSETLYGIEDVRSVRSLRDPLGAFPPDREFGLFESDNWRRIAMQNHRLTRTRYQSQRPEFEDRMLRLDVLIKHDPFSTEAGGAFRDLQATMSRALKEAGEPWTSAEIYFAGTTPSIADLRTVTLADTTRIKIAVVIAVFLVLIVVIKRWAISLYLIGTVLLSYYATLGITYAYFCWLDGPEFMGLDWKLPLFLFVILVAVGQDYNVYLVTRILEEQRRRGSLAAIRLAVARTGGIITACGLVMAATFFSMTASSWIPGLRESTAEATSFASVLPQQQTTLRGIVELGFALGLGVLIDTLYVRTVLVPSFVVLHDRYRSRTKTPG
ncbi:MAG: MMPL family transporter [Planctomycetota bacterium]